MQPFPAPGRSFLNRWFLEAELMLMNDLDQLSVEILPEFICSPIQASALMAVKLTCIPGSTRASIFWGLITRPRRCLEYMHVVGS